MATVWRVGVVEDDVGGLAAQFEADTLGVGRRVALDLGAGAAGSGERHHVDIGVLGDGRADLGTGTGHQVEHAGRQTDLVEHLGQQVRVERRHLGRLEHHGATGGDGRGDLADDQVQRIVPGRDGAHDADRLLDDQRVVELGLPVVVLDEGGEGLPLTTAQARLDHLGERLRGADLVGDHLDDVTEAGGQGGADVPQVLGPNVDRRGRPRREGGLGRGDRGVDVGRRALRHRGDDLFGCGVDDVDRLVPARGNPFPIDIDRVVALHPVPPGTVRRWLIVVTA